MSRAFGRHEARRCRRVRRGPAHCPTSPAVPAPYASSSNTCPATPTAPSVHPAPDPGLHFAQPGPPLVERTTTGAFADSSQLWRVQWVRERRLVRDHQCPRDGRPLTDPLDLARDEWRPRGCCYRDMGARRCTGVGNSADWLSEPGRRTQARNWRRWNSRLCQYTSRVASGADFAAMRRWRASLLDAVP